MTTVTKKKTIYTNYNNPTFKDILDSINIYIEENHNSVNDFNLFKDIVERKCDSLEEEILAQIPIPLYLGLTGTMIGICIGVGTLGLSKFMSGDVAESMRDVKTLLLHVSLAMVSSIIGILATTCISWCAKNTKTTVQRNKSKFYSWILINFSPGLSNEFVDVIQRVTNNLTEFNNVFSKNTHNLGDTLSIANDTYTNQIALMESFKKLNINNISTTNIKLYEKLKNSTEEIGKLAEYLKNIKEYMDKTHEAITDINKYFKQELDQIDKRGNQVELAVVDIDSVIRKNLSALREHSEKQYNEFYTATVEQQNMLRKVMLIQGDSFKRVLDEQEKVLLNKLAETTKLVEELQNLKDIKSSFTDVKNSVGNLEQTVKEAYDKLQTLDAIKNGLIAMLSHHEQNNVQQNNRIDALIKSIEKLATKTVYEKDSIEALVTSLNKLNEKNVQVHPKSFLSIFGKNK